MRQQYHFRKSPNGYYAWDVLRLVEFAKGLEVENVPLSSIKEIDENYWYDDPANVPTCRALVDHFRLIQAADLKYPIILCADGGLMDGMHRVCKALLQNDTAIKAVRFKNTPEPDYTDVTAEELPY